jgi:hypothetical protein
MLVRRQGRAKTINEQNPKAACFWIFEKGHSASRPRLACVLRSAPLVPMGRVRESRPVSTRPRRPCPPFPLQSLIANGQWYKNRPEGFSPIEGKFLRAFLKFCKWIRLRLTLARLPAAVVHRLSFDSVEYPFSGLKN